MECGDYVRLVFSLVLVSLAAVSMLIVLLFQFSKAACKQNGKFKRLINTLFYENRVHKSYRSWLLMSRKMPRLAG